MLWRMHSIHHSLDRLEMLRASYFYPIDIFLTVATGTLAMLMVGVQLRAHRLPQRLRRHHRTAEPFERRPRLRLLRPHPELARTSSRPPFRRTAGQPLQLRQLLQLHRPAVRDAGICRGIGASSIRSGSTTPIGCRRPSCGSSPRRFAGDAFTVRCRSSRRRPRSDASRRNRGRSVALVVAGRSRRRARRDRARQAGR